MTHIKKNIFTDKILRLLYSSKAFQMLSENQQQQFFDQYRENEHLAKLLEVAEQLEETVLEVEAFVPQILQKDFVMNELAKQHAHLKAHTIQKGNILFVPFEQQQKLNAPLIVLLQLDEQMQQFEILVKGSILPLFNVCVQEKRDLIIMPFGQTVLQPLHFDFGQLNLETFDQLIHLKGQNTAAISPAIEKAMTIFETNQQSENRQLFIVTNNQFNDFSTFEEAKFEEQMADLNIEVNVVAMSELQFEIQPIYFADKAYFIHE